MKGKKTIFDKLNIAWEGGKSVIETFPKVAFFIRSTCLNKINMDFRNKKVEMNQNEKAKLIAMITEVKEEKAKLGEDWKCTVDDYQDFVNKYFFEIDQEDRNAKVSMMTAKRFHYMSEFIDFLTEFEPLNEDVEKLKKYCKFKATDIVKSLKKGEVPRRGGPKEEDDPIGNEFEEMIAKGNNKEEEMQGGGQQGVGQYPPQQPMDLNQNMGMPQQQPQPQQHQQQPYQQPQQPQQQPQQQPYQQQPHPNQQLPPQNSIQGNSDEIYANYSIQKLSSGGVDDDNQKKYVNSEIGGNNQTPTGPTNPPKTYQNNNQFTPGGNPQPGQNNPQQPQSCNQGNPHQQQQQPHNQGNPHQQQPPQDKPQQPPQDKPQQPPQDKPQQPPQVKPQGKPQQPPQVKPLQKEAKKPEDNRVKDKITGISIDPNNPNQRIITSKVSQVIITVPVQPKTMNYYKLVDAIKKNTEEALKESKKNKNSKALEFVENSLAYLNLIK